MHLFFSVRNFGSIFRSPSSTVYGMAVQLHHFIVFSIFYSILSDCTQPHYDKIVLKKDTLLALI